MSEENGTAGVQIENVPEKHRYVIRSGETELGFTQYVDRGDQRVFLHTEIDPAQEGRGYGSALMAGALTQVRGAGLRAVPICPFMVRYLERHDDFADVVDPVTLELRASLRR